MRKPSPGIFSNKMDELVLLMRRNKDFSSSVLCFTETWLSESISDCAVHLEGFKLCTDVISKHCFPALEYLY